MLSSQVGAAIASVGLSAVLAFTALEHPPPAHAVTPEQLLFLEVGRHSALSMCDWVACTDIFLYTKPIYY